MPPRPSPWMTAVAAVAVGLSACGDGSDAVAKVPSASSPPGASTSTRTPSAGASTRTITASTPSPTSSSAPTTHTTTAHSGLRAAADLRSALLNLTDLPSGFAVMPAGGEGVDIGVASSKDPRCAPLVRLSNRKTTPGSNASANVTFTGGQSGPFVDESIDALGSAEAVEALQASFRSALTACRQLAITVPGQRSFTMNIVEVSAPKAGEHTLATRMTAAGGAMDGLEITQVTAGVNDVVVSMTFVAPNPEDVDGGTATAVGKAEAVLGRRKTGA